MQHDSSNVWHISDFDYCYNNIFPESVLKVCVTKATKILEHIEST